MESPAVVYKKTLEFVEEDQENSVVCFDFFDTLVTRSIMPEYTKKIAARQLSRLLVNQISSQELYDIRHRMEAEICAENQEVGEDLEFNLKDLAKRLYQNLSSRDIPQLNSYTQDAFIEIVLDIELAVEKQVQRPCPDMIELLQELKDRGVTTLLISDFYLPKVTFSELLHHHGLENCFDHVYISCDYLKTKGSGRLYDLIVKELCLEKQVMLMIGDNSHADKKMAKEQGMEALLLDREAHYSSYQQWEKAQADPRSLQQSLVAQAHKFDDATFPEMSLTLWYFTHRLFDRLISDGVKNVFFLSREGEFLKSLFFFYQHYFFGREIIKSHYLVASRKSTYIASLETFPDEDFSKLFHQYRDISPRDFLLSLNFTEAQCEVVCKSLGIASEKCLSNFPESKEFLEIKEDNGFRELYESLRSSQRDNFNHYIRSFGVNIERDGLFLVDVGWKGSMQENLFKILGGRIQVSGYYIGLLSSSISHPLIQKTGILFNEIPAPDQFFSVYNNNRSLFEMMLGASHGSAEGYFLSQEEVEQRDNGCLHSQRVLAGQSEEIFVAVAETKQEEQLFGQVIQPLQEQIRDMFCRINQCLLSSFNETPPEDWFAGQHGRMVFLPKKQEVDFFESLYHLENFGVFEFTTFKTGEKLSLFMRISNLKAVVTDPPLLEIGFWPPVILRHLGIGSYRYVDGLRRYRKIFGLRRLACILASS